MVEEEEEGEGEGEWEGIVGCGVVVHCDWLVGWYVCMVEEAFISCLSACLLACLLVFLSFFL